MQIVDPRERRPGPEDGAPGPGKLIAGVLGFVVALCVTLGTSGAGHVAAYAATVAFALLGLWGLSQSSDSHRRSVRRYERLTKQAPL